MSGRPVEEEVVRASKGPEAPSNGEARLSTTHPGGCRDVGKSSRSLEARDLGLFSILRAIFDARE